MGVEKRKYIKEVKYFSPNGKNHLPNGHPIQKGGFVKECKDNSAKFKTNNKQFFITRALKIVDSAHTKQYVLPEYKGGIIVFTSETNALEIDKTKLFTWFSKKIKSKGNTFFQKGKLTGIIDKLIKARNKNIDDDDKDNYIAAFSIGNFFTGRYIDNHKKVFNEKSISIELGGISSKGLKYLAEEIATEFKQESVLIKDLKDNKIFLINKTSS